MEDAQIIDLYWIRSESAIQETSDKYGRYLGSIAHNIVHSAEDAEECVNDTYLHTWNAIPPTRPKAFQIWLGKITRNLSLDVWKRQRAQKRGGGGVALLLSELEDCLPSSEAVERHLEDQELAGFISAFLRTQREENRVYFLRRYWYGESLAQIAQRFGVGEGAVKSALFRTRRGLKEYLEREGVSL